jgi:hypothetical protein
MKQIVLDMHANDQDSESGELGLMLTGLVDDDGQEQTFVLALVMGTVLTGALLVGIGLYLSILWGV